MDDLNRLHKLNDYDGIKLRVFQIYKELADMEEMVRDASKVAHQYFEDAEKREKAVSDVREAAFRG